MSCPESIYKNGAHTWLQYKNGKPLSVWKCLRCGTTRRRRKIRGRW